MQYFRHYKGNYYCVIGEARHSETLEEMVVYQALYGNKELWVRPKAMFYETVTLADGQQVPRFAPCSEAEYQAAQASVHNDAAQKQLFESLLEAFRKKGYTAEDFYGGCALCGDANEFALDAIEAQIKAVLPNLPKFDRDRLTSQLYSQLHKRFEEDEI